MKQQDGRFNPAISTIALNVNGQNIPIERQVGYVG